MVRHHCWLLSGRAAASGMWYISALADHGEQHSRLRGAPQEENFGDDGSRLGLLIASVSHKKQERRWLAGLGAGRQSAPRAAGPCTAASHARYGIHTVNTRMLKCFSGCLFGVARSSGVIWPQVGSTPPWVQWKTALLMGSRQTRAIRTVVSGQEPSALARPTTLRGPAKVSAVVAAFGRDGEMRHGRRGVQ
jgi:hypothetical protein